MPLGWQKSNIYICTHTTPGGGRKHCGLPAKEISRKQMPTAVMTSWIYAVMTCHVLPNCGFCDLSSSRAYGWACNTFMDSAEDAGLGEDRPKPITTPKPVCSFRTEFPSSFHKTASTGGPGKQRTMDKRKDCRSCRIRDCAYDQRSVLCKYPRTNPYRVEDPRNPSEPKCP